MFIGWGEIFAGAAFVYAGFEGLVLDVVVATAAVAAAPETAGASLAIIPIDASEAAESVMAAFLGSMVMVDGFARINGKPTVTGWAAKQLNMRDLIGQL